MKFEFNQGVPTGCIDWLWANVGPGNIYPGGLRHTVDSCEADTWKYERVFIPKPNSPQNEGRSVPTITVKNPKLAALFALRWA